MIASARLPFQPRPLKPTELSDAQVQMFYSPKCGRLIQAVGGTPTLTFFILCEFDRLVEVYVERPCQICIGNHAFDISLWLKLSDGRERYVILVADSMLVAPGWCHRRDAELLRDAARRNGIDLTFVLESSVIVQCALAQACARMLPFVQAARRLPHLAGLRDQICRVVQRAPRCNLSGVEREFRDAEAGYVRAVVCDLIHQGALRVDGESVPDALACIDGGHGHD